MDAVARLAGSEGGEDRERQVTEILRRCVRGM